MMPAMGLLTAQAYFRPGVHGPLADPLEVAEPLGKPIEESLDRQDALGEGDALGEAEPREDPEDEAPGEGEREGLSDGDPLGDGAGDALLEGDALAAADVLPDGDPLEDSTEEPLGDAEEPSGGEPLGEADGLGEGGTLESDDPLLGLNDDEGLLALDKDESDAEEPADEPGLLLGCGATAAIGLEALNGLAAPALRLTCAAAPSRSSRPRFFFDAIRSSLFDFTSAAAFNLSVSRQTSASQGPEPPSLRSTPQSGSRPGRLSRLSSSAAFGVAARRPAFRPEQPQTAVTMRPHLNVVEMPLPNPLQVLPVEPLVASKPTSPELLGAVQRACDRWYAKDTRYRTQAIAPPTPLSAHRRTL